MEVIIEEFVIYGFEFLLVLGVLLIYLRKQKRESKDVGEKRIQAKADGLHESVSLYPVIDPNRCKKSGAFVSHNIQKEAGNMQTSLAVFNLMNNNKTDRRFAYIQHIKSLVKNVDLFCSA